MNIRDIKFSVWFLLVCGIVFMLMGIVFLGDVTIGIACASIALGLGVDLFFGIPAVCVLSYMGGMDIIGFVFLGFGFSRLLVAWVVSRTKDKS